MRLPGRFPPAQRATDLHAASRPSPHGAIEPQGCNVLEGAACAAAIAGCVASGVGVVACLTSAAPHCIKCL
jgi:hypothetical protein